MNDIKKGKKRELDTVHSVQPMQNETDELIDVSECAFEGAKENEQKNGKTEKKWAKSMRFNLESKS